MSFQPLGTPFYKWGYGGAGQILRSLLFFILNRCTRLITMYTEEKTTLMIKPTIRFNAKYYANVSRMHLKAHLMHLKAFLSNCIQQQTTASTRHAMHYHTSMLTHRDMNTSHAGQYLQLWQVSQFLSSTENQLCALWLQKLEKKGGEEKKGYNQASHISPLSKSSQFIATLHNHPKARHNNWTPCQFIT